ncbi:unnamed protein product [Pedinophyceae sp. YPF-701]|nr:unnamed protein product [Pedinophyceae sp. YPF-701]
MAEEAEAPERADGFVFKQHSVKIRYKRDQETRIGSLKPLDTAILEATRLAQEPAPKRARGRRASGAQADEGAELVGVEEAVCFTGAAVQSLHWLPHLLPGTAHATSSAPQASHALLAASLSSARDLSIVIGDKVDGAGVIQLWTVASAASVPAGFTAPSGAAPHGDATSPLRLVHSINHADGVAWGVRWRPGPPDAPLDLAAAHSSHAIAVYRVTGGDPRDGAAWSSRVLTRSMRAGQVGCKPSSIAWLDRAPYDVFAVGGWDGSFMLFRLRCAAAGSAPEDAALEGLLRVKADKQAIRSVCWLPDLRRQGGESGGAGAADATPGLPRGAVLSVAGDSSQMTLWDMQNCFVPLVRLPAPSRAWTRDHCWATRPYVAALMAQDDGKAVAVISKSSEEVSNPKDARSHVMIDGDTLGSANAIDVSGDGRTVLVAGEDGEAFVFEIQDILSRGRNRSKITPVAWQRWTGRALQLGGRPRRSVDVQAMRFLRAPARKPPEAAPGVGGMPWDCEVVLCAKWGPEVEGQGTWLALAGRAGLIRFILHE